MIRVMMCLSRRQDTLPEDFRQFWNDGHPAALGKLVEILKPVKTERALTLAIERNERIVNLRGTRTPCDAVVELWWNNARDLESIVDSDAGQQALDAFVAAQEPYIDHASSSVFFTEEPVEL